MHEEFILRQVKRCNKNLLLVNLLILLAVILIMSFSYNYYYNFFFGPFTMDAASLTAIRDLKDQKKEYVTVRGSEVFHTGLQYIEETFEEGTNRVIDTRVTTDYLYLVVNDWLLVVKAAPGTTDLSYTGALKMIPADLKYELATSAAQKGISVVEFDQIVLPFMVDAQSSKAIGYIGLFTCLPLFLLSVWNLLRYGKRVFDPLEHPIYKKLEIYGIPEEVANGIDEDIASTGVPVTEKLIISNSWLVRKNLFGLTLVPLQDVLWMYKNVTQHKVNYIIPAGKSYGLVIHLNKKKKVQIGMNQKKVDAAIELIQHKVPSIACGYSDELAYLWNKNFPAFLVELEKLKNAV